MPNAPLFVDLWDDLLDTLGSMSRATGYHHDYGSILEDRDVSWDSGPDFERPPIHVRWEGESEQAAIEGGETAASRFRHFERIGIAVPIRSQDGLHTRRAFDVRADIHAALLAGTSRARGTNGRACTYDTKTSYAGNEDGGVLEMVFHLRWDHVTGDHSSQ